MCYAEPTTDIWYIYAGCFGCRLNEIAKPTPLSIALYTCISFSLWLLMFFSFFLFVHHTYTSNFPAHTRASKHSHHTLPSSFITFLLLLVFLLQVKSQNVGKTAQLANEHHKNSSTPKHTHTAASMCNPIHKRAEFGGNDKQNRVAKLKKKEKEEEAEEKRAKYGWKAICQTGRNNWMQWIIC